jgi:retron-type reverse transcriptase
VKFVEHRVADRPVVRLIQKWLSAGVLEDGTRTRSEVGTVQGGSISPLLANPYLHCVFDLWTRQWRQKRACGDVIVMRFADDFVVGFQRRCDAEQSLVELKARFVRFGLELHPDKTRSSSLVGTPRWLASDAARGSPRRSTFSALPIAAGNPERADSWRFGKRCERGCRRS